MKKRKLKNEIDYKELTAIIDGWPYIITGYYEDDDTELAFWSFGDKCGHRWRPANEGWVIIDPVRKTILDRLVVRDNGKQLKPDYWKWRQEQINKRGKFRFYMDGGTQKRCRTILRNRLGTSYTN